MNRLPLPLAVLTLCAANAFATGGRIEVLLDGSTLIAGTSGIWTLSKPSGTLDVPAGTFGRAPVAPAQPPRQTAQGPNTGPAPLPTVPPKALMPKGVEAPPPPKPVDLNLVTLVQNVAALSAKLEKAPLDAAVKEDFVKQIGAQLLAAGCKGSGDSFDCGKASSAGAAKSAAAVMTLSMAEAKAEQDAAKAAADKAAAAKTALNLIDRLNPDKLAASNADSVKRQVEDAKDGFLNEPAMAAKKAAYAKELDALLKTYLAAVPVVTGAGAAQTALTNRLAAMKGEAVRLGAAPAAAPTPEWLSKMLEAKKVMKASKLSDAMQDRFNGTIHELVNKRERAEKAGDAKKAASLAANIVSWADRAIRAAEASNEPPKPKVVLTPEEKAAAAAKEHAEILSKLAAIDADAQAVLVKYGYGTGASPALTVKLKILADYKADHDKSIPTQLPFFAWTSLNNYAGGVKEYTADIVKEAASAPPDAISAQKTAMDAVVTLTIAKNEPEASPAMLAELKKLADLKAANDKAYPPLAHNPMTAAPIVSMYAAEVSKTLAAIAKLPVLTAEDKAAAAAAAKAAAEKTAADGRAAAAKAQAEAAGKAAADKAAAEAKAAAEKAQAEAAAKGAADLAASNAKAEADAKAAADAAAAKHAEEVRLAAMRAEVAKHAAEVKQAAEAAAKKAAAAAEAAKHEANLKAAAEAAAAAKAKADAAAAAQVKADAAAAAQAKADADAKAAADKAAAVIADAKAKADAAKLALDKAMADAKAASDALAKSATDKAAAVKAAAAAQTAAQAASKLAMEKALVAQQLATTAQIQSVAASMPTLTGKPSPASVAAAQAAKAAADKASAEAAAARTAADAAQKAYASAASKVVDIEAAETAAAKAAEAKAKNVIADQQAAMLKAAEDAKKAAAQQAAAAISQGASNIGSAAATLGGAQPKTGVVVPSAPAQTPADIAALQAAMNAAAAKSAADKIAADQAAKKALDDEKMKKLAEANAKIGAVSQVANAISQGVTGVAAASAKANFGAQFAQNAGGIKAAAATLSLSAEANQILGTELAHAAATAGCPKYPADMVCAGVTAASLAAGNAELRVMETQIKALASAKTGTTGNVKLDALIAKVNASSAAPADKAKLIEQLQTLVMMDPAKVDPMLQQMTQSIDSIVAAAAAAKTAGKIASAAASSAAPEPKLAVQQSAPQQPVAPSQALPVGTLVTATNGKVTTPTVNGKPLVPGQILPVGTVVDATQGGARLVNASEGVTATSQVSNGVFKFTQVSQNAGESGPMPVPETNLIKATPPTGTITPTSRVEDEESRILAQATAPEGLYAQLDLLKARLAKVNGRLEPYYTELMNKIEAQRFPHIDKGEVAALLKEVDAMAEQLKYATASGSNIVLKDTSFGPAVVFYNNIDMFQFLPHAPPPTTPTPIPPSIVPNTSFPPPINPIAPQAPLAPPTDLSTLALKACTDALTDAAANKLLSPAPFITNCVADVKLAGSLDFIAGHKSAYLEKIKELTAEKAAADKAHGKLPDQYAPKLEKLNAKLDAAKLNKRMKARLADRVKAFADALKNDAKLTPEDAETRFDKLTELADEAVSNAKEQGSTAAGLEKRLNRMKKRLERQDPAAQKEFQAKLDAVVLSAGCKIAGEKLDCAEAPTPAILEAAGDKLDALGEELGSARKAANAGKGGADPYERKLGRLSRKLESPKLDAAAKAKISALIEGFKKKLADTAKPLTAEQSDEAFQKLSDDVDAASEKP